jgi:DNA-binding CsgD family transcriptional regulator
LDSLIAGSVAPEQMLARLAKVWNLAGLRSWWRVHVHQILGHDCAVVGEADYDSGLLRIRSVLLHEGGLHGDVDELLGKCSRLVTIWSLMEEPCELDLGSCDCVGERSGIGAETFRRRFLVHAAPRGSVLVFVVVSSAEWTDTIEQKRLLAGIAAPLASACGRFAERRMRLSPGEDESSELALTAREAQIVSALSEGMTNKEIARRLGLSPNTVRNQIANLSTKVGARSRAQLALLARQPPYRAPRAGD